MPSSRSPAKTNTRATRASNGGGRSSNGGNGQRSAPGPEEQPQAAAARPVAHDDIARRAYELYEAEGRQAGRELEYWLRAEAELGGRAGS